MLSEASYRVLQTVAGNVPVPRQQIVEETGYELPRVAACLNSLNGAGLAEQGPSFGRPVRGGAWIITTKGRARLADPGHVRPNRDEAEAKQGSLFPKE